MRYGHMVRETQANNPLPPMARSIPTSTPTPTSSATPTSATSHKKDDSENEHEIYSSSVTTGTALPIHSTHQHLQQRKHQMNRPLSKNAKTLALDVRNQLTKAKTPAFAMVLLAAPFVIAFFALLSSTTSSSKRRNNTVLKIHPVIPVDAGLPSTKRLTSRLFKQSSNLVRFDLEKFKKKQRDRHTKLISSDTSKSSSFYPQPEYRFNSTISKNTPVTLIAACRDRHESLLSTYPSWSAVEGIDQIVLVEWSDTAYDWDKIPNLIDDEKSRRLTVVLTKNIPDKWILTRAYNLASKFAIFNYVLKVDCDTRLQPDFLSRNPPPAEGDYYTVTWGTERSQNEQHLHGVWFAHLKDFQRIGGYDERITSYGYEDVELYDRFNKLAGLTQKSIDLDSLRHYIGSSLQFLRDGSGNTMELNSQVIISKKVSKRINKKLLETLPKWQSTEYTDDQPISSSYHFLFDKKLKLIIANCTSSATVINDPLNEKSAEQKEKLFSDVLRTGLHDDFELPWDLLDGIEYHDLYHLANYLDHTEPKPHINVIILQGQDALTNIFNVVSSIVLGVLRGKPTIIVWTLPDDGHITNSNKPLLSELFDMNATNTQLFNLIKSDSMTKYLSVNNNYDKYIRIIPAYKWCTEELSTCAKKYDAAYGKFTEISNSVTHVYYDEENPVPISSSTHTVIRLNDKTLIGNHELRKLAMRSLVPSETVRHVQTNDFHLSSNQMMQIGIVAPSSNHNDVMSLANDLKRDHHQYMTEAKESVELVSIVGRGHIHLRQSALGRKDDGDRFCGNGLIECTVKQIATQVANVYLMCSATEIYPKVSTMVDKDAWLKHDQETDYLVAADLWQLYHQR